MTATLHPEHAANRQHAARLIVGYLRDLNNGDPLTYEAVMEFAGIESARLAVEKQLAASKAWTDDTWDLAANMSQAARDERVRIADAEAELFDVH